MSMKLGAAALTLLLASSPIPSHAETVELALRDGGRTFRGEIAGGEGGWVEIRLADSGSSVALEVSELDPDSIVVVYRHRRERMGQSPPAADRMALAEFCLAHGLYLEAIAEFRGAAQKDPALASRAADGVREANDRIADRIADRAFELIAGGKDRDALLLFEKILEGHPDSVAARRAEAEIARVRERVEADSPGQNGGPAPPGGAGPPGPGPGAPAPIPAEPADETPAGRALDRLSREIVEAEAAASSGVEWEGRSQPGKALAAYRIAERAYDAILPGTAALRRGLSDAARIERLLALEKKAKEGALRLYLALAHFYAAGHQLQEARAYVNRILAIDPDHAGANALRDKITEELIRGR